MDLPFDIFHVTERNGPFPHGQRSKVVIRSDRVISTEIHTIARNVAGPMEVHIANTEAALFHYRRGDHMMGVGGKEREQDLEMLRYLPAMRSHSLLASLMETLGEEMEALSSWTERVVVKKRKQEQRR